MNGETSKGLPMLVQRCLSGLLLAAALSYAVYNGAVSSQGAGYGTGVSRDVNEDPHMKIILARTLGNQAW